MRYFIPALALLLCHEAAAQMFKCTDKAGKVTYSSVKCGDLGLKDAGEVKDRIQVTPAPPAPQQAPASRSRDDDRPVAKPAAAEPATPERRCFTTNVKGKSVTRCNDKPDEETQ